MKRTNLRTKTLRKATAIMLLAVLAAGVFGSVSQASAAILTTRHGNADVTDRLRAWPYPTVGIEHIDFSWQTNGTAGRVDGTIVDNVTFDLDIEGRMSDKKTSSLALMTATPTSFYCPLHKRTEQQRTYRLSVTYYLVKQSLGQYGELRAAVFDTRTYIQIRPHAYKIWK